MTKFEKAIFSFLCVVALGLLGLVIWTYQTKWNTPLGPALQFTTLTPIQLPATWTPDANATSAPLITPKPVSVSNASPFPETPIETTGICGAPSVTTILAIGSDTRGEKYLYGLADVIRLIRVDSVTPRITMLEIPRDLWVEIPDIADNLNGQDHEKLNQAYLYGNPGFGYTNDPTQGPGLLARTLVLNFGTQIDHYAAVNMQTFVKIVDAVGGIDINLLKPVDGRTADDTDQRLLFFQGENHLNGTRALTLARIRIDGTFQRADNQNRVLCALRKKLTSPSVITKIPDLIKSFQGAAQTDFTPQQISQLACVGTQTKPENIVFTSFPENLFKQNRIYDPVFKKTVFVWNTDYKILRTYIEQFNKGTWPQPTIAPQPNKQEGDSQICQ